MAEAPAALPPWAGGGPSRVGVPALGSTSLLVRPSRFSAGAGESGKSTIVKQMK